MVDKIATNTRQQCRTWAVKNYCLNILIKVMAKAGEQVNQ